MATGDNALPCTIMATTGTGESKVNLQTLRQDLSVYLRRLYRCERPELTDRGRRIVLHTPLGGSLSPVERLVAQGRATMPAGNALDLPPPLGEPSTRASEALSADRDERFQV